MTGNMKGVMPTRLLLILAIAAFGHLAAAQELYRWTDEKGRTQITDIAPPPGAKDVRKIKPAANTAAPSTPGKPGQPPFALARAMKEYPITLYTSPNCTEPCNAARDLLNKRGVPFSEVQVWEEESNAELKRVSGNNQVPTLKVGSTVHSGYEPTSYGALLDSAGYPAEGVLPAGTQTAPGSPEGYVAPDTREVPKAQPEPPAASGPYAPGARPQRAQPK
jgi:glutaredoxin